MTNFPFPKEPFQFLFGSVYPLFASYCSICLTKRKEITGVWKGNIIYHFVDGYITAYGAETAIKKASEEGDELLKEEVFKNHIENLNKLAKKRQEFIHYLHNTDLSNLSNEEIANLVGTFSNTLSKVLAYFVISRPECTDHLSEDLLSEMKKQETNESKLNKDFSNLTFPTDQDIIKKEHKLRLELKKDPTQENIKKHILSFPWLYWTEYNLNNAIEQLKSSLKNESIGELQKTIENEEKGLTNLKNKKQETLNKYKSNTIHILSNRISWLGHNRLEVKSLFAGLELISYPLFKEIERRTNISINQIMANYLPEDLKTAILTGKKITDQDITKRKNIIFYNKDNQIITLQGKKAKNFSQYYLSEHFNLEGITEVKGTIASKGKTTGKVRIIRLGEDSDLSSFQEGEILLSEMTQPRMMPIMKKARAIVTDEGGLASHAAIISRELGIPCIVGTHKATRVFKDGDLVEVDANEGTVKLTLKNDKTN